MATKAEIVQNLLDSHQITPEQAVILLTSDSSEKQYIFIERYPITPYYPSVPQWPINPFDPFYTTCYA